MSIPKISAKKQMDTSAQQGNRVGLLNIPGGYDLFKPEAKMVKMAILPYQVVGPNPHPMVANGDWSVFLEYNRFMGLGSDRKGSALNYSKTFGQKCAISELASKFDKDDKTRPRNQRMAIFNIYLPEEKKVCLFDFSYANFAKPLFTSVNAKIESGMTRYKDIEYYADPECGYWLYVTFKESVFDGSKFFEAVDFDYEPHGGLKPEIIAKAVSLNNVLQLQTYAEVHAKYVEGGFEDPDDTIEDIPVDDVAEPVTNAVVKPAVVEKPAEEAPVEKAVVKTQAPQKRTIVKGEILFHADFGRVKVVKVVDDVVTVMDDEDEPHKVHEAELHMGPVAKPEVKPEPAVESKPKTRTTKPKTPPAPVEPAGDDDDWGKFADATFEDVQ